MLRGIGLLIYFGLGWAACAQTAEQGWIRYGQIPGGGMAMPVKVRALGEGIGEQAAVAEIGRRVKACCERFKGVPVISQSGRGSRFDGETVVGTLEEMRRAYPDLAVPASLKPDGYWIYVDRSADGNRVLIAGANQPGVVYGAFAWLRYPEGPDRLDPKNNALRSEPAMAIRWTNEWDNADGTVERGYGGRSIFFEGGKVREDLAPVREYARLLASVGINGCNVNNVNNAAPFLEPEMLAGLARIADTMRPWGVRLAMSVDIASPQKVGGLDTYDPVDARVKAWWAAKVEEIYKLIPDLAGFTVKADSEGQPGPASYGRTPADAANVLANALQAHGGVVMYRAFVYNHHLDWKDAKADRARAAYDIFHPLDGKFAANVIVQIKEGPIDFQAREPVSPLFAGLEQTNEAMELQITQEYLGQQRHLVYIAPMWKEVLDTDLRAGNRSTPVKEIVAGRIFHRPLGGPGSPRTGLRPWGGGMVGVASVGREWLGSPMAMANLYAFGRLAWDPNLRAEQIAEEWTKQTVGIDEDVVQTVEKMLMESWPAYERYTGPLGLQTLTDITGSHYGPNVEASENNGWGQWHRADHGGVGMDRSVATGTGYAGQYPPELAKRYENAATTPDDLLLFFHHVPYTYKLDQSGFGGKTVIQYIYDSHYEGAREAAELGKQWATLQGRVDAKLFEDVRGRLAYQAGHAVVWRDAVVQYFLKLSGIADEQGRAGHNPGRLEAEDAKLSGYAPMDVQPWEDASRGRAVACGDAHELCSAEWTWEGKAGTFDVAAEYFDLRGGTAKFALLVNGKSIAGWNGDGDFPSRRPNGDNSTRMTVRGVELKAGDVIRVEGAPDGEDRAALDYVEVEGPGVE
jgi:alpha-glucuronidase